MTTDARGENAKRHLERLADETMAYLVSYEKDYGPRQLILGHKIKGDLGDLLELLECGKMREGQKLWVKIESKLVSLFELGSGKRVSHGGP